MQKIILLLQIKKKIKSIPMKKIFTFFMFLAIQMHADISLDAMMTQEQKQQTGINQLNYSQKMALQKWISENFTPKYFTPEEDSTQNQKEPLYLSLNVSEGEKLKLSDGSAYEVAPEDRFYTKYWVTPLPVMLGKSTRSDYPIQITNMNTGTSIHAKRISTKELLQQPKTQEIQPPPNPKKPPRGSPKRLLRE